MNAILNTIDGLVKQAHTEPDKHEACLKMIRVVINRHLNGPRKPSVKMVARAMTENARAHRNRGFAADVMTRHSV